MYIFGNWCTFFPFVYCGLKKAVTTRLAVLAGLFRIVYYSIYQFFQNFRFVHVIRDFCPWDLMIKLRYFLMVQIYNLRTLEVEHDLETCQRPWSTWVLTLWASHGPENGKWSIKNNYYCHYVSWTKIPDDMNKSIHKNWNEKIDSLTVWNGIVLRYRIFGYHWTT